MEPGPVKSCPGILLPPGSRSHQAKVGWPVSRSFKTPVTTLDELSQAISLYISRGAEKLRYQESFAEALTVYVMTNRFKSESYYYNSKTGVFPTASNNTPELIRKGKC